MRHFDSGATRDSDDGKPDYEGFLSPLVIRRFGEYMHKHRIQKDGKSRASDNWQGGMGLDVWMKSLVRHLVDAWGVHRGMWPCGREGESLEDLLCAIKFNTNGYLDELLKKKDGVEKLLEDAYKSVSKPKCDTCKYGRTPINDAVCYECVYGKERQWEPRE